ncbi:putative protein O-GlcNAc transferase [Helianthus debilis subsp. tardiflorus]
MDAAASMIEKASVTNPTYGEAYNNLGNFYGSGCKYELKTSRYQFFGSYCISLSKFEIYVFVLP